jgi:hypothetical protein
MPVPTTIVWTAAVVVIDEAVEVVVVEVADWDEAVEHPANRVAIIVIAVMTNSNFFIYFLFVHFLLFLRRP